MSEVVERAARGGVDEHLALGWHDIQLDTDLVVPLVNLRNGFRGVCIDYQCVVAGDGDGGGLHVHGEVLPRSNDDPGLGSD